MTRAKIAGGAIATVLVLLALAAGYRALNKNVHPVAATPPAITPSTTPTASEPHPGFLYGRIITVDGTTYQGRLRWGATRRRSGATTSTASSTRTPGSPKCS